MKPAAWARRAASSTSSRGTRRPPRVGDVVVHRGREQERVVVDHGDRGPQGGEVEVAHVGAVDQHRAGGDVVEAREELDERRLARPGRADEGDRAPRLDDEVDVAQGGLAGAAVGEAHVAQLDAAAPGRQRLRVARRGQPGLAVEQLEHPRARRGRALRHAERDPELAHRADQHQQVGVEGGEVAEAERPVDHLAPAHQQDHRQAEVRQEAEERVVEAAQPVRVDRLVEDPRDRAVEAGELAVLGGERLDHAHAGHVLLDVGGELGDALLHLLQRGTRLHPVAPRHEDHERHRREREQRQLGLQREHRAGGEHDRQAALQQEHEPVAEEEAHGLQVDGRARHQLPRLLLVEEAELERLQARVEPVAQVVLDAEGDLAGHQPAQHGEHEAHQHDREDRAGDEPELGAVAGVDRVDAAAGQPRDGHRGADRERREHHRRPHSCAVGAEKAQQAQEDGHAVTR